VKKPGATETPPTKLVVRELPRTTVTSKLFA